MVLLVLAGCSQLVYRDADVVIADAHGTGGSLAISQDSSLLVSSSWSGRISVWRLPEGSLQHHWRGHQGDVKGVFFLADGRILSAGYDGDLRQWTAAGVSVAIVKTGSPVTAMAVDVSRQHAVTGHADGRVRLWSLPEMSPVKELDRRAGAVRAVAIASDAVAVASSAVGDGVRVWRAGAGLVQLPGSWSDVRTLVFTPDEKYLYGGGWFDLYRWNLAQQRLTVIDTDHNGIINSILFHPKENYLLSISRQTDSSVLSIDPVSGNTIRRYQPHKLCGGVVVVSPDGRTMVTTADDASLMIWNLGDRESLLPKATM